MMGLLYLLGTSWDSLSSWWFGQSCSMTGFGGACSLASSRGRFFSLRVFSMVADSQAKILVVELGGFEGEPGSSLGSAHLHNCFYCFCWFLLGGKELSFVDSSFTFLFFIHTFHHSSSISEGFSFGWGWGNSSVFGCIILGTFLGRFGSMLSCFFTSCASS